MIKLGLSSTDSQYVLASALSEAGQNDEAAKIIANLPENIDTLRFKLSRLQSSGDWNGIAELLDAGRALYEDPDRAQMEAMHKIATIEASRSEKRIEMVDQALRSTPDDPLHVLLWNVYGAYRCNDRSYYTAQIIKCST